MRRFFSRTIANLLVGRWERPFVVSLPSGSRVLEVTGEGLENPDGNVRTLMDLQRQTSTLKLQGFSLTWMLELMGIGLPDGTTHRGSGGHEVVNLQTRKRWVGEKH